MDTDLAEEYMMADHVAGPAKVDITFPDVESCIRMAQVAVDALLEVEWRGAPYGSKTCCPCCSNAREGELSWAPGTHRGGCTVDAALTQASLVTQEQRDAARRQLAGGA